MKQNITLIPLLALLILFSGYGAEARAQSQTELVPLNEKQTRPQPTFKSSANPRPVRPQPMQPQQAPHTKNDSAKSGEKTLIYLDHSEMMKYDEQVLPDVQILIGDVILHHDSAYLYCDSAYFNQPANSFDAYGRVRIEQGDSITITARKLIYNGNTKIAYLTDNVILNNGEVTLTTDTLTYNRNTNTGFYKCGGTLCDSANTLTSQHGYYFADTKMAEFNIDVEARDDDSQLCSDTLTYDTETKIATILGPANIYHEDATEIYTELGWYNMDTDIGQLLQRSVIKHEDGKTLKGDTIYYDKTAGFSKVFHNVELIDTTKSIILSGHYAFYQEDGEIAILTDSALMREYSQGDTVYVHADTLYTYAVGEENMVHAYHNARLYQINGQGVADSIVFFSGDSIVRLLQLPILWTEDQQITADTIFMLPERDGYYRMQAKENAIIVQQQDTAHYNQMSGKEIIGYIKDEALHYMEILGNAQSIFFPAEEGTQELIGLNSIESSYMTIYFIDGKLDRLKVFPQPKAAMYPMSQVNDAMLYLQNFTWQHDVRPLRWEDVFLRPKRATQADIEAKRQALKEQEKAERDAKRSSQRQKEKEKEKEKDKQPGNADANSLHRQGPQSAAAGTPLR